MSSCSGCKSSSSTANAALRLARKMKGLEPSNLDSCLKCECNKCTCECKLTITANETIVKNDMIFEEDIIVEGTICGNLKGTVVGNICAGLIKGTVQMICDPATTDDITITSADLITQIRIDTPGTYPNAALQPGSEGQLKIIQLVADTAVTTVEIALLGTSGGDEILTLTGPVVGSPSSAQLYYIAGNWYAYQVQNGTLT